MSGESSATLNFPASTEVRVTGTVRNINSLFGAVMSWSFSPFATGTTNQGATSSVDTTYVIGGSSEDRTVAFSMNSLFTSHYSWDFVLTATGPGCPPSDPESCSKRGGNAFFDRPVTIDGQRHEGCYRFDSCIKDVVATGTLDTCDEDDPLLGLVEDESSGMYLLFLNGFAMAATAADDSVVARGTQLGPRFGPHAIIVAGVVIVGGIVIYIAVNEFQAYLATLTEPAVVDEVTTRLPSAAVTNPRASQTPRWELVVKTAMALCISSIAIDHIADNPDDFGLLGWVIDRATGFATPPGGGTPQHLCELVPVYLPGGITEASSNRAPELWVSIEESSLHIRDVLYNERNQPDTVPPPADGLGANPPLPKPGWRVLTYAAEPDGTSDRFWYTRPPYGCQGSSIEQTNCDEFPWYGTRQGGPGAHLRIIDGPQNLAGGSDFESFTSGTGCGLAHGDTFVVLPQSVTDIRSGTPSVRFCG